MHEQCVQALFSLPLCREPGNKAKSLHDPNFVSLLFIMNSLLQYISTTSTLPQMIKSAGMTFSTMP